MTRLRLSIVFSLMLLVIWLAGLSYFHSRFSLEQEQYTQRQLASLNIAWTAVQHLQQKGKDVYFNTYINQPDLMALMQQAQLPALRAEARHQVEQKLSPVYQQLKQDGIFQFHIVLPDNTSFIRLHLPEKYGDNLTDLRHSFRLVNQTLEPIYAAFEAGRVVPGFRTVYPLIYKGEHLGSVEFSNMFETLRRDIAFLDPDRDYALIIHPRMKAEIFAENQNFYGDSLFAEGWLEEDPKRSLPGASPLYGDYLVKMATSLRQDFSVLANLNQKRSFGYPFYADGGMQLANFIAIHDLKGDTAAYLVGLSPAPFLDGIRQDFINNVTALTLIVMLLGLAIFYLLKHRDELRIAASAFDVQEGITITDSQARILKVNKAFTRLTGFSEQEVLGKTPAILSSGRQDPLFYQKMWQVLKSTGHWQGEIWNRRKNGQIFAEWLTITAVYDAKKRVTNYVGAFLDITQRKEDEEKIKKLAFYDPLTDLPNRRLLMERLEHAIKVSDRTQRYGAVLFIDMDNFKALNDTKGHDVGDQMLLEVARRLKRLLRESDTVARLGGDEFVVLLEGLDLDLEQASLEAELLAEKLRDSLNQPYDFGEFQHFSSPSIGIALFYGHQTLMDEVLKNADSAMYQAKNAGRNTVRLFDPKMQACLEKRLLLEKDLYQALVLNQLEVYYQPQVDQVGRIIGAELLLRWQHPERGMISPAEFIPIAESNGAIIDIGHWVIQQACITLRDWAQQPGLVDLSLSVNVSARQFQQSDFVEQVLALLARYQVLAERLKFEVTESVVVVDIEDAVDKMNRLSQAGVEFSIDDFGTGHSSLSLVHRLPVRQVKIDQSFVRSLTLDPTIKSLIKSIVVMARSLDAEVLAEGVETREDCELLIEQGCYFFQGYYFAKPMPYKGLMNFVGTHLKA
ncbi:EAL domain-containing protein [Thiomicrospira microaerophila]|uniref:bifunctional diguanylate cyclase/phosphodiesterase n=1 Tax=Thiomicrospira microaerophila TaxID=406020 RepID=UPI00200C12E1|nr:EAL domain-containing protein [Thiomicrospira microaerophila]UQB41789.1 EAL domain-containing protein [Thiomicrospira microaerophila]